jgi:hypothetical protein
MGPHRANVINLLNLIATREDQIEYQRLAPVNVANELVNQWFNDFYHPSDKAFRSEFSNDELAQLANFNEYYERRVVVLPDTLDALLNSSEWNDVVALARNVLDGCGWRGIEARYDF